MSSGAGLLAALRLVVILDDDAARGRDPAVLARAAAQGGATMLQVRAKHRGAREMAAVCRAVIAAVPQLPVVVNDRLDVALATAAAGCHLGQDDLPINAARGFCPPGFVIGGSAGTEDEARRAHEEGADYLGIGPIAASPSKHDAGDAMGAQGFARIRAAAPSLPCVAIGGVTVDDVAPLLKAGAAGIAVIGAVLDAPDAEAATRALGRALREAGA